MKLKNIFLSLLLSVILILTMIPSASYAYDSVVSKEELTDIVTEDVYGLTFDNLHIDEQFMVNLQDKIIKKSIDDIYNCKYKKELYYEYSKPEIQSNLKINRTLIGWNRSTILKKVKLIGKIYAAKEAVTFR